MARNLGGDATERVLVLVGNPQVFRSPMITPCLIVRLLSHRLRVCEKFESFLECFSPCNPARSLTQGSSNYAFGNSKEVSNCSSIDATELSRIAWITWLRRPPLLRSKKIFWSPLDPWGGSAEIRHSEAASDCSGKTTLQIEKRNTPLLVVHQPPQTKFNLEKFIIVHFILKEPFHQKTISGTIVHSCFTTCSQTSSKHDNINGDFEKQLVSL